MSTTAAIFAAVLLAGANDSSSVSYVIAISPVPGWVDQPYIAGGLVTDSTLIRSPASSSHFSYSSVLANCLVKSHSHPC